MRRDFALSKHGCRNGIAATLNLENAGGTTIASATGTSSGEAPMEIVQISIGGDLQEWTNTHMAHLTCLN